MRNFMMVFVLGCTSNQVKPTDEDIVFDSDGDGYLATEDCNDSDSSVYPQALELCDGVDNDCDGSIDEEVTSIFYADADGDGFGSATISTEACEAGEGFVATGNDCNDADAQSYPGAEELCDGIDNNCDAQIDEGLELEFYVDADGDGFGDDNQVVLSCEQYLGLSTLGGDCDDEDDTISPLSEELCDELDNNCDGAVDEGVLTVWYRDFDEDGFGDVNTTLESCVAVDGYIEKGDDCDDTESLAHPSAIEICDGIDNDCDGQSDEAGAAGSQYYYEDLDQDGYGNADVSQYLCTAPVGYVDNLTDCDDTAATVYPFAVEYCNGGDDDCDGDVDEDSAVDVVTWYADSDGDGFGAATASQQACIQPSGFVADSTDCNDGSASAHPDAAEVCDELDNNCDGQIDEGVLNTYYTDIDGDGYGSSLSIQDCTMPTGFVAQSGDCDDEEPTKAPDQQEVCDGLDNNCDGDVDEGLSSLWYIDADGDGFGDPAITEESCLQPGGYVNEGTDCDDGDGGVAPDQIELCDGSDNDCDGLVDNGVLGTGDACAAESCLELLADGVVTDGLYWLDITGVPSEYDCDMTTSGGGWTQIVAWNRVDDGDTQAELFDQLTSVFDNMTRVMEDTSRVTWCDQNSTADVMAYTVAIPFANNGESMVDVHYVGSSMEESAMFFYFDTPTTSEDVLCRSDFRGGYSASELSYAPYSCSTSANASWTWDATYSSAFSDSLTSFNMRSFHYDGSFGDRSSLYRLNVWVR